MLATRKGLAKNWLGTRVRKTKQNISFENIPYQINITSNIKSSTLIFKKNKIDTKKQHKLLLANILQQKLFM